MELTFPGLVENTAHAVDAVCGGLGRLGNEALIELARAGARNQAQAQALYLAVIAEVEARGVAESLGALDTKNWLRSALNVSPSAAARQVRVAVALAGPAADTGHALATGEILDEQANVICEILGDAIDPDGPEPTDHRKACAAHIRDNHDGTETCTWTDTSEVMAMLRAVITKHYAPVQGEPGAPPATTSTGQVLTPAQVQRIACDADLTPIVLNGKGVPLFVGRKYRTVTPGQWAALVVRDGGCVFPQCDRPPDLCEAHHPIWWENFGNTDLDNLALLCFGHHDFAHQGWEIRVAPDGLPEVIPPPWVDPQQRPRRNEYWRLQRQLTLGLDLPKR